MAQNIEQHSSTDIFSLLLLLPLRDKLLASPSFFPSLSSLLQFDPSNRPFRSAPLRSPFLPSFHLIRFPFEKMSRFRICPLRQRDVYIRGGRQRCRYPQTLASRVASPRCDPIKDFTQNRTSCKNHQCLLLSTTVVVSSKLMKNIPL